MEGLVELRSPEMNTGVEDTAEAGGLQARIKSQRHYSGPAIVPRLTKGDNGGEGAVELRSPEVDTDVEDAAEDDGLQARSKSQNHYSGPAIVPRLIKGDNSGEEPSENAAYLHENGGALEDLDFLHKIPNSGKYDEINYGITETTSSSSEGTGESLRSEITEEEIVEEEEVVELEFQKAIPKLHTHTMHCPNCDSQITKVVLRRKIIRPRPQPQPPPIEEPEKPIDLLGCLSCFSLFTSTEQELTHEIGNPFSIFRDKRRMNAVPQPDGNKQEIAPGDNGNCFSIFRVFRKEPNVPTEVITKPSPVDSPSPSPATDTNYDASKPLGGRREPPLDINGPNVPTVDMTNPGLIDSPSPSPGPYTKYDPSKPLGGRREPPLDINGPKVPTGDMTKPGLVNSLFPSPALDPNYVATKPHGGRREPPLYTTPKDPETSIDIPPATLPASGAQTQEPVGQDSTSFEILKSVVYGGLMEVIASLSVVASAVAADATTLTVVALALANLIGGIFVISHNLWDLKDDYYKFQSQETNQVTRNKYKELLGQVVHFPMHVFFAILSFIMFGIVPPVVYGYSFHKTNDKDFTIVVVASASLVCVGLLAIFKAYVTRCIGFLGYIKIIAYYLTTTIAVSGVSYVVGNLVTRLIKDLGLFETTPGVAMSFLPEPNPSLAYY